MISVLLVDDHSLIRMGFRLVLGAEADIEVAGEAADGTAAVSMCSALHPDVVLMDVRMPGRDGVEATRDIVAAGQPPHVVQAPEMLFHLERRPSDRQSHWAVTV